MIKLRVTVPKNIALILKRDQEDFEINENKHYNIIYKNMNFDYSEDKSKSVYKEDTELLQFTLSKENFIKFDTLENKKLKKADFFRQLITEYAMKSSYERELIVFKEHLERIKVAIENNKRIEIKFKNRDDILDPYFIASLEKENRNYLVSYSYYKEKIVNYRIKNISNIIITNLNREPFDEKYIKDLSENFNPFLSFGNEVKVRFTREGEKYYKQVISNRPKLKGTEGDIYIFEANDYQAMLYFAGFMEMVEILEPLSLREKMIERAKMMIENYLTNKSKKGD
ncbi:WYL domain-containing protein [Cetobacterium somerae]|uniref:WYL domain-containing protein n=1 Tax=Cetobacterium sp. NK01 TaxID=2993530 RepID=UPI002115E15C|nr:WYL domain-containing protein [Cetobacterium sp. NK01]MCQ8213363.1 WYL domain-containing protein [Cetobacterium sp. NK01]